MATPLNFPPKSALSSQSPPNHFGPNTGPYETDNGVTYVYDETAQYWRVTGIAFLPLSGGIISGSLTVENSLNAVTQVAPIANSTSLGLVKQGSNIIISADGTISSTGGGSGGGGGAVNLVGAGNGIVTFPADGIGSDPLGSGTGTVSVKAADDTISVTSEGVAVAVENLNFTNNLGTVTSIAAGPGLLSSVSPAITESGIISLDFNEVVRTSGDQAVAGVKTFSDNLNVTNLANTATLTANYLVGDGAGITNLTIPPLFNFLGSYDVTGTAPENPTNGDFYMVEDTNNGNPVVAGSTFAGIDGTTMNPDQILVWSSNANRWFTGNSGAAGSGLPLTGGTITGDLTVNGIFKNGDLTYPTDTGNPGQVLTTNGSNTLYFSTVSGGGGVAGVSSVTVQSPLTTDASGGVITSTGIIGIQAATTTQAGAVQLNNTVSGDGVVDEAATANAAYVAYDRGSTALTAANNAQTDLDVAEANLSALEAVAIRGTSGSDLNISVQTVAHAGTATDATNATNASKLTYNGSYVASTAGNTANTIVARDDSGDFSAGIISATFSGNGSSLTSLNASALGTGTVPGARLPVAEAEYLGGISTNYSQTGKNYPVKMSGNNAYVNVPWENTQGDNTVTSISGGSSFVTGEVTFVGGTNAGVSQSGNTITITSTDTNTNYTYAAGNGLSLSGSAPNQTFSLNQAANGTAANLIGGIRLGYGQSGGNRAVQVNGSGQAYINVSLGDLGYTGSNSANDYSLPTASGSTLGGIKVGTNLSISSGVLSSDRGVYSVATGDGLTGGTITGSGTINLVLNGSTLGKNSSGLYVNQSSLSVNHAETAGSATSATSATTAADATRAGSLYGTNEAGSGGHYSGTQQPSASTVVIRTGEGDVYARTGQFTLDAANMSIGAPNTIEAGIAFRSDKDAYGQYLRFCNNPNKLLKWLESGTTNDEKSLNVTCSRALKPSVITDDNLQGQFVVFTGTQSPEADGKTYKQMRNSNKFKYNSSNDKLTVGTVTAYLEGNISGQSTSCSGNAATSSSCSGNAATSSKIYINDGGTLNNSNNRLLFISGSGTGYKDIWKGTSCSYNPTSNTLSVGTVNANLNGTATNADYADNAGKLGGTAAGSLSVNYASYSGYTTGSSTSCSGVSAKADTTMVSTRDDISGYRSCLFSNTNGTYYSIQNCTKVKINSSTGDCKAVKFTETSDYRVKKDIVSLSSSIDIVKALNPVSFKWNSGVTVPTTEVDDDGVSTFTTITWETSNDQTQTGFIAHEVQELIPSAVDGVKDGNDIQSLQTSSIVPVLTKALQEALTKIEALEQRLADAGIA